MTRISGIPASPGLAIGVAVVAGEAAGSARCGRGIASEQGAAEMVKFDHAVLAAAEELREIQESVAAKAGEEEAAIFAAQRMMLEDPTLRDCVKNHVLKDLISVEGAAALAVEEQAKALEEIPDAYLSARAQDLRDIGKRLVRLLIGELGRAGLDRLCDNAVVVASDLAPSDTASLDVGKVVAIVLDKGGRTSHTAILARSLGIPAVVATIQATALIRTGDRVAVDGRTGIVTHSPDECEMRSLRERAASFAAEKKGMTVLKDLPAVTLDGRRIELAANIGSVADAYEALSAGADGVGLFRTEFLFVDRDAEPSEDEQFEVYKQVLSVCRPRPVVIRTLDIGGDKGVPYLNLPPEANPFLGVRAVRLCLRARGMFRTQLRALLRASPHGNLRIMFPMISTLDELLEAKAELAEAQVQLACAGVETSSTVQVGIMVEVPAAAVDADVMASECDFFSLGTNDLVQYTMACDRGNPEVAYLSDPFAPAVLKLIKRTIDEGHKHGIWVGMCGEMAGMPEAIPLLMSMGLDEFSMSCGAIPGAKQTLRGWRLADCEPLWDKVRQLRTAKEVRRSLVDL